MASAELSLPLRKAHPVLYRLTLPKFDLWVQRADDFSPHADRIEQRTPQYL
jgi:hypothetical protein